MECGTRGIQVVPRRKLLVILGDVKDQKGGKEGQEDKNPQGQGEKRVAYARVTLLEDLLESMEQRKETLYRRHDNKKPESDTTGTEGEGRHMKEDDQEPDERKQKDMKWFARRATSEQEHK